MLAKLLKKEDTIGVIAPSDPLGKEDIEILNNSILKMEQAGFKIEFGKNVFENPLGYSATPKQKADDIHYMFQNDKIKAIFCASGGFNSNSILDELDYGIIENNPKILCGFSDSTTLLNGIYQKTGIVTFHGPTFKALTSWDTDYGYEEVLKRFVKGSLELGQPTDQYEVIQEGEAEGILIGGNLSLIKDMVTGKYAIDFKDKILFIEELIFEAPPGMISHCLYHMKQNGVFDQIKGMWIGNYESSISLEKLVLDTLDKEKHEFPIIKSNNFGHTDKKTVIPIGTKARIKAGPNAKIELLEPCLDIL